MPTPVLYFSESNGSTPVVTDNITTLVFANVDQNSTVSNLAANNPVPQGARTFEKWIRMNVHIASTNSLSAFGAYYTSGNITDGGGGNNITGYFGTNATYATPVNTTSAVATTLTSTVTTAPGTSFTAPSNTVGAYSGYITMQCAVGSSAGGGNSTFPANWLNVSFVYS